MIRTISSIISYILNPLIFPTLGLVVILNSFQFGFSPEFERILIILFFSGTFFLPALFFPIFKYYKLIDSFDISNKKDRLLPLLIVFSSYFLTYLALKRLEMPPIILICILSPIVSLLISFFVTLFWKISIHMIGIGGFTGMIIALPIYLNASVTVYFMITLLLLSGLLGSARLFLKAHTANQVYIGFFTGLITVFLIFSLFFNMQLP